MNVSNFKVATLLSLLVAMEISVDEAMRITGLSEKALKRRTRIVSPGLLDLADVLRERWRELVKKYGRWKKCKEDLLLFYESLENCLGPCWTFMETPSKTYPHGKRHPLIECRTWFGSLGLGLVRRPIGVCTYFLWETYRGSPTELYEIKTISYDVGLFDLSFNIPCYVHVRSPYISDIINNICSSPAQPATREDIRFLKYQKESEILACSLLYQCLLFPRSLYYGYDRAAFFVLSMADEGVFRPYDNFEYISYYLHGTHYSWL